MNQRTRSHRSIGSVRDSESDEALLSTVYTLRIASLHESSVRQYQRAVQLWQEYCSTRRAHSHHPSTHRLYGVDIDNCVSRYLAHVYRRNDGRLRQLAVGTVYGIYLFYPSVRGQLVVCEQMLGGWRRLHPTISHPPLTWPLVTLIAVTMAHNHYMDGALGTLVAFDGLLRISEMSALRVGDVSAPSDRRRGGVSSISDSSLSQPSIASSSHVLLRLAVTKTGSNQWVELTNYQVEHLLLQHISHLPPTARVFNLRRNGRRHHPSTAYRIALKAVCKALGIESQGFTPHSLRHGGATHALQHLRQSVETVMLRGRWQSASSCRTYLQAGRAQLLQSTIDPQILALAHSVESEWYHHIASLLFQRSTNRS